MSGALLNTSKQPAVGSQLSNNIRTKLFKLLFKPNRKKPAISPKRCKIAPRLLLWTSMKLHTRFRLVPKSVTLNNLERRIQGLPKVFKYALLSQERVKLRTSNLAGTFTGSIRKQNAIKNFGQKGAQSV